MLVAAIAFPLVNALIKLLGNGYPTPLLLWFRYTGHLAIMLLIFLPHTGRAMFVAKATKLQVVRSLTFCASTFLVFFAIAYVPLATTSAIQLTAPLMVTLVAPLALRERLGWMQWLGVAAGFVGALITVNPDSTDVPWAALLVVLSAACAAATQICSRLLAGRDRPATSNFYMAMLGAVLATALLPISWMWPQTRFDLFLLCMIGVVGGLGHYFMVRAFELAPASFVAPYMYLQIVGAAALGSVLFGTKVGVSGIVGALTIVAGGLLTFAGPKSRVHNLS